MRPTKSSNVPHIVRCRGGFIVIAFLRNKARRIFCLYAEADPTQLSLRSVYAVGAKRGTDKKLIIESANGIRGDMSNRQGGSCFFK